MTRDELIEGLKSLRLWHNEQRAPRGCPICKTHTIPCKTFTLADEAIKALEAIDRDTVSCSPSAVSVRRVGAAWVGVYEKANRAKPEDML